jgi:hypothetical protein
MAEQERAEREKLAQEIERLKAQRSDASDDDEDDDGEPYVDRKRLKRELSKFKKDIDKVAEEKARNLLAEENRKNYLYRLKMQFPDYDQVMNEEAIEKFTSSNPAYAERILKSPDEFERRELAYHAIKSAGLHKKEEPKQSMQDIVNQNAQNPYYHPSSASPPGKMLGDFSPAGQKAAYEKLRELQGRFGGR